MIQQNGIQIPNCHSLSPTLFCCKTAQHVLWRAGSSCFLLSQGAKVESFHALRPLGGHLKRSGYTNPVFKNCVWIGNHDNVFSIGNLQGVPGVDSCFKCIESKGTGVSTGCFSASQQVHSRKATENSASCWQSLAGCKGQLQTITSVTRVQREAEKDQRKRPTIATEPQQKDSPAQHQPQGKGWRVGFAYLQSQQSFPAWMVQSEKLILLDKVSGNRFVIFNHGLSYDISLLLVVILWLLLLLSLLHIQLKRSTMNETWSKPVLHTVWLNLTHLHRGSWFQLGSKRCQPHRGQQRPGWSSGASDQCNGSWDSEEATGWDYHADSVVESQATAWCSDYVKTIRKYKYQLMSLY